MLAPSPFPPPQEESTLRAICDRIILPNIFMRESDEEAFEDNAIEFIRQDIEGSDSDTRVRGAAGQDEGVGLIGGPLPPSAAAPRGLRPRARPLPTL